MTRSDAPREDQRGLCVSFVSSFGISENLF